MPNTKNVAIEIHERLTGRYRFAVCRTSFHEGHTHECLAFGKPGGWAVSLRLRQEARVLRWPEFGKLELSKAGKNLGKEQTAHTETRPATGCFAVAKNAETVGVG